MLEDSGNPCASHGSINIMFSPLKIWTVYLQAFGSDNVSSSSGVLNSVNDSPGELATSSWSSVVEVSEDAKSAVATLSLARGTRSVFRLLSHTSSSVTEVHV